MSRFSAFIVRISPLVFVVLWATGFVGAKYGTQDAEPYTFLAIRFAITFAILLPMLMVFIRPVGVDMRQVMYSVLIGCFIHSLYLGGVFHAVHKGMAAGISSLIVALQPFIMALIAMPILHERLQSKKLLLFVLALVGVGLVLFPDGNFSKAIPGITAETLIAILLAALAISLGAVLQKRLVTDLNLWVGTTAQFAGAAFLTTVMALAFEEGHIVWSVEVVGALVWLILVLSIGAVALLMYLIRVGDASSVASLFFLVPVVAMFMTWILFDEALATMQLVGSALVVLSVAIVNRMKTSG